MANRRRTFRVGERIQELIAQELNRMADPRFYLVTIASAVMSSDLRHAKVYWLIHGDEERRAEAQEAFDGAAGHFKRLISRELGIKFAPTVSFFYDDTLDQADEMERLFQRIREGSQSSE